MIVWGFVIMLSAMQPNHVGPYRSLNECYAKLSDYIAQIAASDTGNQYRGACLSFARRGITAEPGADTQWLTSNQLKALAQ